MRLDAPPPWEKQLQPEQQAAAATDFRAAMAATRDVKDRTRPAAISDNLRQHLELPPA